MDEEVKDIKEPEQVQCRQVVCSFLRRAAVDQLERAG